MVRLASPPDCQNVSFARIEKAIHYITHHFKDQPSLEDIAVAVNLSPFHLQRLFSQWAGVSPKKFSQFITITHAKSLLRKPVSVLETAYETGLSGPSRLHDHFVTIEAMTPGEFKNGGKDVTINYSFAESPFGMVIIASTQRGICHIHFVTNQDTARNDLIARYPAAVFLQKTDQFHQDARAVLQQLHKPALPIRLHLSGTPFQIKVWESLLKIPMGNLTTYGAIAEHMGRPSSARAVGMAIGNNPIAYLIPCHRVIQKTGHLGGYMWGHGRKTAMIGWESAKVNHTPTR